MQRATANRVVFLLLMVCFSVGCSPKESDTQADAKLDLLEMVSTDLAEAVGDIQPPPQDAGDLAVQDLPGPEDVLETAPATDAAEPRLDLVDVEEPDELQEDVTDSGGPVVPMFDPSFWGPYEVGVRTYGWYDPVRQRSVPTTVWYPAVSNGEETAVYLLVVKGKAYMLAAPDLSEAPYPLILFSHGFNGKAEQSITFTEYVASHGYVVAAMDHVGNTLTDFGASDEEVAQVALERPYDVSFVYDKMSIFAMEGTDPLAGMVDPGKVGMTGHSFGGYTALMVGGGEVDVDKAKAACEAGSESDVFCPYIGFWEAGSTAKLDPPLLALDAVVSMAPGGHLALGDAGLAEVKVPTMIVGGAIDGMMPVDIEAKPIYEGLPPPKMRVIVDNAGHMSFTNICDLPQAELYFTDFCDKEGMLPADQVFALVNTLAVAYLNLHVRKQNAAAFYLTPEYVAAKYGYAEVMADP